MNASPFSVCVFCGSRPGARPAYAQVARETGRMIAAMGWRLVYGAGDVGLMGEVARAAQENGARTLGIIPEHLQSHERGKRDLDQFIITQTMHERKKVMFMNSNAIVVLPGGAGSLDEFFEVLTWRQLGLHEKPIILLNPEGYWAPLSGLLDHMIHEGFADTSLREFVQFAEDVPALEATLRAAFSASRA